MATSETLSQQEIDLLFGGAAVAEAKKPAPRDGRSEVQIYDFRRPSRISKDRMRALEAMYGLLGKSLESWLMGRVRSQVELHVLAVEQFSFGEFLLSLSTPCAAYVYDIAETGGQQAVIDFGREFSYFLIDRLLGGSGGVAVQNRPLSMLERMIVRLVADQVAAQLGEVWQDHVRLDLSLSRFETMPEMLQITNREDPVLVANIEVSAGTMKSLLILCLPFAVLEKFFTGAGPQRVHAARGTARDREADRLGIEASLRSATLPVHARLPEIRLTMRELASLRPGGMLTTGIAPDAEADLFIAGRRSFRGVVGRAGRKIAVRITGSHGGAEGGPAHTELDAVMEHHGHEPV